MNNYYFTESKWYGPITTQKPKYTDYEDHVSNGTFVIDSWTYQSDLDKWKIQVLSLPSGPSLIPEFAGMVKEEGKDFEFKEWCERYEEVGVVPNTSNVHWVITAYPIYIEKYKCYKHEIDYWHYSYDFLYKLTLEINELGNNLSMKEVDYVLFVAGHQDEWNQTAVPVAEEKKWTDSDMNTIAKQSYEAAEEGKQTFTMDEVILAMQNAYLQGCDVTAGHKKGTSTEYITEYLKTKQ